MEDDLQIKYNFIFEDHTREMFTINLDRESLEINNNHKPKNPSWTKLTKNQCYNCQLSSPEHTNCPIAANINNILPIFKDKHSFDKVLVKVHTEDRSYEHETSLQQSLSSLIGIIMVTSGCPSMKILKPMVRFHLPFATLEETIFRSASSYLMGQFFRYKNGKSVDWHMNHLSDAYESIQYVNMAMADRLRNISEKDAGVNAVIVLDVFAKELPFSIEDGIKKLEYLYKDFIEMDV